MGQICSRDRCLRWHLPQFGEHFSSFMLCLQTMNRNLNGAQIWGGGILTLVFTIPYFIQNEFWFYG